MKNLTREELLRQEAKLTISLNTIREELRGVQVALQKTYTALKGQEATPCGNSIFTP